MKAMIVDDEPIFMMGMRKLLSDYNRAHGTKLRVVAEVYDGTEALEEIPSKMPDIVFTDIRMASLDGLTTAKEIMKRWPHIQVVVVSGYPSFENAREAIKANVVDFLQKPVHPELFSELITKLIRQYKHQQVNQYIEQIRMLEGTKEDGIPSNSVLTEVLAGNRMSFFILRSDALSMFESHSYEGRLLHPLLEIIRKYDNNADAWLHGMQTTSEVAVLVASSHLTEPCLQEISTFLNSSFVTAELLQTGYRCNIDILQLCDYNKLIQQFHRIVTLDQSGFFRIPDKSKLEKEISAYTPIGTMHENKFRSLLQQKEWERLVQHFEQLLIIWEQERCTLDVLESNLIKFVKSLLQSDCGFLNSAITYDLSVRNIIRGSMSYSSLRIRFERFLSSEFKPSATVETKEQLYGSIYRYMQQNLSEPITLGSLSERFEVSISHLCSIFKEYANGTFVELFTEMRIRKAEDLIRSTLMPLKEIAELCGYWDQRYFSKVFKTHTGMTPSEFKSSSSVK